MFYPGQVVSVDGDPLANHDSRTALVLSESKFEDWAGAARYGVVCLTTDFNGYSDEKYTKKLDKNKHTETGSLTDHSLVCPWAMLAVRGDELAPVMTDSIPKEKVTLNHKGHEIASRAVYRFLSAHNDY